MAASKRKGGPVRVALVAYKGGVGKTTVTVNTAGAAAAMGLRVLVVDADQQGASTRALKAPEDKPTLYECLHGQDPAEAVRASATTPGVDVLPADLDLAGAEVELARLPGDRWQTEMRAVLDRLLTAQPDRYDLVLLDTPPGLGVLSFSTVLAADHALVVTQPAFLDYRGLQIALRTLEQTGVPLLGVVANKVGRRTLHQTDALEAIDQLVPGRLLLPLIPDRVSLRDASTAGKPLAIYDPGSDVAALFPTLVQEVMSRARS